jgi:Fic family protein
MMDLAMFRNDAPGQLVAISGNDPALGPWKHRAFVPSPLGPDMPALSPATYLRVADARAALAALDSTARQLPNPTLLRSPTLRTEAQSTSALEGTYAPLAQVLTADEDEPGSPDMREILNYLRMANHGFAWVHEGRPITTALLCDLNALLMTGMPLASVSGRLRDQQVSSAGAPTPTGPASRSTPRASCLRPRAPRSRSVWKTSSSGCARTT